MARLASTIRAGLLWGQAAWVAVSLYQSAITVLGRSRAAPVHQPRTTGDVPRFGLIVCARDEATVIGSIVTGLLSQEYPAGRFEVVVVAHNCTDDTASVAARAGARVIEAHTPARGKVRAILVGLEALGPGFDYVGVFDADTRVPATLLATIAGASAGEVCLQAETVPHETGDWLATGYGLGRRARNLFWWRPREALGLGTTVNGTGYFIQPHLLRTLLSEPRAVTEDLELTARLAARGQRVAYVSSTYVRVEEPHTLKTSVKQRARWARGHFAVLRYDWPPVLRRALRGDFRAFDMAVYLAIPTRVLTRSAVTCIALLTLVRAPFALPAGPVMLAMAGEWLLPASIAVRERLVPMGPAGLRLALRHGLLGALWYPIGLWGLITARSQAWEAMPRRGGVEAVPGQRAAER